jgi:hypothetical protein
MCLSCLKYEDSPPGDCDDASACSKHVTVGCQDLHSYTYSSCKCSCNNVLEAGVCAIVSRDCEQNDRRPSFLVHPVPTSGVGVELCKAMWLVVVT